MHRCIKQAVMGELRIYENTKLVRVATPIRYSYSYHSDSYWNRYRGQYSYMYDLLLQQAVTGTVVGSQEIACRHDLFNEFAEFIKTTRAAVAWTTTRGMMRPAGN
eukprot:scaffold31208_cov38-Prasinocladus_malaysianus.AAC.1